MPEARSRRLGSVAPIWAALTALLLGGCGGHSHHQGSTHTSTSPSISAPAVGIHKIRHVVVIMQENRSFDSYFGTYPGADGIPMRDGQPAVCIPDSAAHGCVRPYHDRNDLNVGGPHAPVDATADIAGGAMDGFVAQQRTARAGCEHT